MRISDWSSDVCSSDLQDPGSQCRRPGPRARRLNRPVVEVCAAGAKCTETGLTLNDIWRYFRHTWAHEYRPIPGRQMLVLIRNAARPRRPIMGIAMLASPEIGRASCRERVCQYVWISVVAVALKKKKTLK